MIVSGSPMNPVFLFFVHWASRLNPLLFSLMTRSLGALGWAK